MSAAPQAPSPLLTRVHTRFGARREPLDLARLPSLYPPSLAWIVGHMRHGVDQARLLRLKFQCNQDCVFCNVQGGHSAEERTLDMAAARFFIDSLWAPERAILVLSGGEPTVMKGWEQLVSYALEVGVRAVVLQTNAIAFATPGKAQAAADLGLWGAFVSLHAPTPELSHRITQGHPDDWRRTVAGIHALMDAGIQTEINVVLCRDNFRHAAAMAEFLLTEFPELAATATEPYPHRVCVSVANPFGKAEDNAASVLLPFDELGPHLRAMLDKLRAAGVAYNNPSCGVPFCVVPGHVDTTQEYLMHIAGMTPERVLPEKSRAVVCHACVYRNMCPGPWKGYQRLFGDRGLSPVSTPEVPLAVPSAAWEDA